MSLTQQIETILNQAQQDDIQKHVVGAFIVKNGKFLIVKRSEMDDFLPGLHEIPSGGVDEGEDLKTALSREVLEETGLTINMIDQYINHFDYISGSGKKARQYNFLVSVNNSDPVILNPEEHSDFFWSDNKKSEFHLLFNFSDKTRKCLIEALEIIK